MARVRALVSRCCAGEGGAGLANHVLLTTLEAPACNPSFVYADPEGDPVDAPTGWPELAADGEQRAGVVTVRPGSRAVAASADLVPDGSYPCSAPRLLVVTASDPAAVVEAYVDGYVVDFMQDQVSRTQSTFEGSTIDTWYSASLAGSGSFEANLVTTPDQPTWLYLTTCDG